MYNVQAKWRVYVVFCSFIGRIPLTSFLSFSPFSLLVPEPGPDHPVSNVTKEPLQESLFVRPFRLRYELEGAKKIWDCVNAHDAVAILIYDEDKDAIVLVRQFRPAVYVRSDDTNTSNPQPGYTYELCAGIVDKDASLEEIAADEMMEECGYDYDPKDLKLITRYRNAIGIIGNCVYLYYARVNSSMKKGKGGGIAHENIEVVDFPVSQIEEFITDKKNDLPPGLMFALYWWKVHESGKGKASN
eukprot:TRINITY_DN2910_c0_g1_i1.p1 TRINITY_DN2910_c0_g1~~TRINITY_DN2910_c0_g1_i1.p1  ORF type:complete len:244 (+),score=60.68 TRINITY_DN2910_c0_g1_i1:152-883(+)